MDKPSLLRICLGLGILLDDAQLVVFAEEPPKGLPEYFGYSIWDQSDYDEFSEYTDRLLAALWKSNKQNKQLRCVN